MAQEAGTAGSWAVRGGGGGATKRTFGLAGERAARAPSEGTGLAPTSEGPSATGVTSTGGPKPPGRGAGAIVAAFDGAAEGWQVITGLRSRGAW